MRPVALRELTADELAAVKKLAQSRTASARRVERARIIQAVHAGQARSSIAARLDIDLDTVRQRVLRFNAGGLASLDDQPRSGRPATYAADERATVLAVALTAPKTLDLPFAAAVSAVTAALKEQGFGVLTEIDVQNTLKQKISADFRRYVILGACNPRLAHQAFTTDLNVGLLLPCNVTLSLMEDGCVQVGIVDPLTLLSVVHDPAVQSIAAEVHERLGRVVAALQP